ncbi:TPA: hypothetical protein ACIVB1_001924 [Salmonella enterica subsp. diarizonae serovar 61:l,v:z35]
MTQSTLTRERLEWLLHISCRNDIDDVGGDEIRELASIALAALQAEPVSFDALRDAVAEVLGGPAMEWSDIYKGHQAVPFINFNSLARIVDKFRVAPPAPVVSQIMRELVPLLDEDQFARIENIALSAGVIPPQSEAVASDEVSSQQNGRSYGKG